MAMERERFAKNMALMSAGSTGGQDEKMALEGHEIVAVKRGSAERWAAIRGFISQTMEQRPDGKEVVGGEREP